MGFGDWTTRHLAGKRDPIKDSMWGLEKWWHQVAAQWLPHSLVVTWEKVSAGKMPWQEQQFRL